MWCPGGYGHMSGWGMAWMGVSSLLVLAVIVGVVIARPLPEHVRAGRTSGASPRQPRATAGRTLRP